MKSSTRAASMRPVLITVTGGLALFLSAVAPGTARGQAVQASETGQPVQAVQAPQTVQASQASPASQPVQSFQTVQSPQSAQPLQARQTSQTANGDVNPVQAAKPVDAVQGVNPVQTPKPAQTVNTIQAVSSAQTIKPAQVGPFPRPAVLEPNVKFWIDVFTNYSVRDFVVLDRDDVHKVYQVLRLPGSGQPSREDVEWVDTYLKTKYREMLLRLASGKAAFGAEERHAAEMFEGRPLAAYALAAENLRVQEGLRENFHDSLLRSRYYRPTMEGIFRGYGVPVELVALALVESGFHPGARSGAGAVGVWQFTRSTGRRFMRVTRWQDDRLNPIRSTEAAAKLLRYNYDLLGTWPLAITAYNYGLGGTERAAEFSGNDFSKILQSYSGPHFGFAVKNYYAEFLAALLVSRDQEKYFPGIQYEPPIAPEPVRVTRVVARRHIRRHRWILRKVSTHRYVRRRRRLRA